MRKARAENSLGVILTPLLEKMRRARPYREEVDQLWRRLAGRQAAKHSWVSSLSKGRMIIGVDSSGWMYALDKHREELLEGLVELLGAHHVRNLSFRIGDMNAQR